MSDSSRLKEFKPSSTVSLKGLSFPVTIVVNKEVLWRILDNLYANVYCIYLSSGLDKPRNKKIRNFLIDWGEHTDGLFVGNWLMGDDVYIWTVRKFKIGNIPAIVITGEDFRHDNISYVKVEDKKWFQSRNHSKLQELLLETYNLLLRNDVRNLFKPSRLEGLRKIIAGLEKIVKHLSIEFYRDHIEIKYK